MQVHTSFFCIFCFLYVVCLLFYAIGGFLFSLYGISQSQYSYPRNRYLFL